MEDFSTFNAASSVAHVQKFLENQLFSTYICARFGKYNGAALINFLDVKELPGFPFKEPDEDEDKRLYVLIRAAQASVPPAVQQLAPSSTSSSASSQGQQHKFMGHDKKGAHDKFKQKITPLYGEEVVKQENRKGSSSGASAGHDYRQRSIGAKRLKNRDVDHSTGYGGQQSVSDFGYEEYDEEDDDDMSLARGQHQSIIKSEQTHPPTPTASGKRRILNAVYLQEDLVVYKGGKLPLSYPTTHSH